MNAWTTLGLKRTSDAAEIRRAYARRLKTIDVDADPEAFIALRQALQRALAEMARRVPPEKPAAEVEESEPVAAAPDPAPALPAEPTLPTAAPEPATAANIRFILLEQLLFPAKEAPPADPDLLATALQAILHHPDMAGVDHRAGVENWLARILHHAVPHSDPVIPIAVAHFGWEAERQAVFRRPLVALIAQRAEDLACIARLEQPGHRWHEAWAFLRRPAAGPLGFRDRILFKPQVAQLLNGLRIHYPDVLHRLDGAQVALWDREIGRRAHLYLRRSEKISWYGWLVLAWLMLKIAGFSMQGLR